MRKFVFGILAQTFCASVFAAEPVAVKAAWFRRDISCDVGATLAGYGNNDVSVGKLDDLEMNGLCVDDGRDKVLVISFDLLALDKGTIKHVRSVAAKELGIKEANVLVSCTHTHGGPHTGMYRKSAKRSTSGYRFPDDPNHPDTRYLPFFEKVTAEALRDFAANPGWKEVYVGFYSSHRDENRNRRYTTAEYKKCVDTVRKLFPGCGITTDIMVGFPGESDEEFDKTCAFVRELELLSAHLFIYSPRPNTPAADMKQVSPAVSKERQKTLAAIIAKSGLNAARERVGQTVRVLAEANGLGTADDSLEVVLPKGAAVGEFSLITLTEAVSPARCKGEIN